MFAIKDGAGSVCDLGTVDVIYRTAVHKANAQRQLHAFFFTVVPRIFDSSNLLLL